MTTPPPKAARPETPAQAEVWTLNKNRYLRLGLCHRCAAQAAWGHQIGFAKLERQPCDACSPILKRLPGTVVNGWTSVPQEDRPGGRGEPGARSRPTTRLHVNLARCGCGAVWVQSGNATAHCASCHSTFASEKAFAWHRVDGDDGHSRCLDPATVVRAGRPALRRKVRSVGPDAGHVYWVVVPTQAQVARWDRLSRDGA